MEEMKLDQEKQYKKTVGKLNSQLKTLSHELEILNVKLKEKDQVRLNFPYFVGGQIE